MSEETKNAAVTLTVLGAVVLAYLNLAYPNVCAALSRRIERAAVHSEAYEAGLRARMRDAESRQAMVLRVVDRAP